MKIAIELSEQGSLFMNSLETDFEKIQKKILDLQKIYKEVTILESKKDHKEKSFKYIKEKYSELLKYYKIAIDKGKLSKQKDIEYNSQYNSSLSSSSNFLFISINDASSVIIAS